MQILNRYLTILAHSFLFFAYDAFIYMRVCDHIQATSIWVEKIAPYLVLDAARTRLLLNRNPVTWSWTSQASLLVTLPMLMVVEVSCYPTL